MFLWIQTFTGKRFPLLFPQVEDICIEDIAHALSNLCRYTGHALNFYCVTPETRILTTKLQWKEAGKLRKGEHLIGFDEYPLKTNRAVIRPRRKIRDSIVLHTGIIQKPSYALYLSDGTVLKSSSEHPWLISTRQSKNQTWRTAENLFKDVVKKGSRRYMLKFIPVWRQPKNKDNFERGYIAGVFDSEGHICVHNTCRSESEKGYDSKCFSIGMAQNPNVLLEFVKLYLNENNIDFGALKNPCSNCINVYIRGDWWDKIKFLGMLGTKRLSEKFYDTITLGKYTPELTGAELVEIKNVEYLGEQEVVALETSTHTYIAEGFGAHNSVAQHSVLVSSILPDKLKLCGLLHDGAEGFIADLSSPLKALLPEYQSIEYNILKKIAEKFVFPFPLPPEVKLADTQLLLAEKAVLFRDDMQWRGEFCIQRLDIEIIPQSPNEAEKAFLDAFFALTQY